MRRLVLAVAVLAAGPASAEVPFSRQQFDETTCGEWEKLDMTARIEALRGIAPFGAFLEASDRGAAEDWADEVALECRGHPDRLLTEAAMAAEQPGG
ncbi:hypothetical protein [Amaricoccus sp.]|uniref:hypothetical protein n=1 Tax=Amaricoccus sp. TaxID=1872485 RepID=UPI001B69ACD7|nr:hypothetical protein [Amaricoccus sp.]MBP7241872.1 hypothetical protein [Amaricoccus sp.]